MLNHYNVLNFNAEIPLTILQQKLETERLNSSQIFSSRSILVIFKNNLRIYSGYLFKTFYLYTFFTTLYYFF